MTEKKCVICGKIFEARDYRALCCSDSCRDERIKQRKINYKEKNKTVRKLESRTCPECGKEFITGQKGRKYCGDECRYKANLRFTNRRREELRKAIAEEKKKLETPSNDRPVSRGRRKRRRRSALSEYSLAAREQGKSYGQLQAEEYARSHRIIRQW